MIRALGLSLALLVLLFLCGCYGSSSVTIPEEYVSTWMFVVYDANGDLYGAGFTVVQPDGSAVATTANGMQFTGTCNTDGSILVTALVNSATYTATGSFTTTDTGSGTWTRSTNPTDVKGHGTFLAYKANGAVYGGQWGVTVTGPPNGTGTMTVDAQGVVSGTTDVTGLGTTAVHGVVTGAGQVAIMWGSGTVSYPFVVGLGTASSTIAANGTWQAVDSVSGTWTANHAP